MEQIIKIGRNIVTNFRLGFWFFISLFLTYYSAIVAVSELHKFIFAFLAAIFAGVFVNLYTDMFGTSKTESAIKTIVSTLNDYYYTVEREGRDLTSEEHKTVRELLKIANILSSDNKDFEIFKKYRKLEIEKKKAFIANPSIVPTYNQNAITFTGLVLDYYGDKVHTAMTGSMNDMVDPIAPTTNNFIGSSPTP